MFVLRRALQSSGALRRLCARPARPFSSSETATEPASTTEEEVGGGGGGGGVVRDHIRTRTRSRVETWLNQFLESRESLVVRLSAVHLFTAASLLFVHF